MRNGDDVLREVSDKIALVQLPTVGGATRLGIMHELGVGVVARDAIRARAMKTQTGFIGRMG